MRYYYYSEKQLKQVNKNREARGEKCNYCFVIINDEWHIFSESTENKDGVVSNFDDFVFVGSGESLQEKYVRDWRTLPYNILPTTLKKQFIQEIGFDNIKKQFISENYGDCNNGCVISI